MPRPTANELTPLTGPAKSHRFLVLDIESKKGSTQQAGFTRPFLFGLYDGEQYAAYYNRNSRSEWHWSERYFQTDGCIDLGMRQILSKEHAGKYCYAHNGGRFDFLFALPWLMGPGDKLGYKFSIIPVSSSIQSLDVWNNNYSWRFLDSYKLIPIGLDRAAKTFGLAGKLKHDLDLHETDPAWTEYNSQDCTELYAVISKFHGYIENVLCGEVGITAPSTAMRLFRRRFLKEPIPRTVESHDFILEGYCGGRVEVIQTEGKGLYYYDINSSYPNAMLASMPAGKGTYWVGTPSDRLVHDNIGFVRADVAVPIDTHIPVLPVREAKGELRGKLLFPVGHLSGVWAWDELQLAVSEGATIQRIHESWWYEPVDLFSGYVNELYQYRDTSKPNYDPGLSAVVKLLSTSTYGKFGMHKIRRKIWRWDDPDLPEDSTPAYPDPECLIWYSEEEVDAPYIMPQIAARVTSVARMNLHRYMKQAISLGGKVYYVDTDSIITDVAMHTSSELGALKDELPEYAGRLTGEFIGPKLYVLRDPAETFLRVKAKGVHSPRHDQESGVELTEDERQRRMLDLVERLRNGDTIYQDRLEKVGTLARRDFKLGPRVVSVPKTLGPERSKRLIHADGTTTPIILKHW